MAERQNVRRQTTLTFLISSIEKVSQAGLEEYFGVHAANFGSSSFCSTFAYVLDKVLDTVALLQKEEDRPQVK
jgi:hypothetical protein